LSTTSSDTALVPQDRVWLALRFGWTLAEVYGRLGENPPPHTPPASCRLFLSDLNPSPDERLLAATLRLTYITRQLFPSSETSSTAPRLESPGEYPTAIDNLLEGIEQRILTGRGKLTHSEIIYENLNPWSRQVWAMLDAEDPLLAEAATLGARLADTFWQWRFPVKGQTSSPKQTWQHLLKPKRMIATIRQVRSVETHLPVHVGPMLRHGLWEWGIVGELTRSELGQLEIERPFLYRLRSLSWARMLRRRRREAASRPPPELRPEEEKALWKRVQHQMIVWEHLVFNRPLAHLLRPSDWRQVRWLSFVLYAGAIVLISAVGALLVAGLIWVLSRFLGYLLPFLAAPTEFKDQLALASTLVAVLAFLATQFRRGLSRLRHLYDSIHDWVMMRKLEQRGLRTWDGQTKPLPWIWLQRLLRAEDA
jgi:hypothetical protein